MASEKGNKPKNNGDDLSTILSHEEQVELTLLIANITEVMRKQITDTFDADSTTKKDQEPKNPLQEKENNPNVDDAGEAEGTVEEKDARELREKRARDLSAPKMQDLKKATEEYFDKWREGIILRLGEVVNSPKKLEEQIEHASIEATPDSEKETQTKVITSNTNIEEADAALITLYPPTSTALYSLPRDKRILLLNAMLLLLLSLERYSSYSRILLLHISSSLHLPLHILAEQEVKVAQGLLEAAKQMSGKEETEKRSDENKNSRRWKVGLAGVAGAAVIGITGGLAAPLVAGAIGTIMGGIGLGATTAAGLLGALAESGVIVGALFGAYGGRMTGKMIDQYAKEVDDFAFLPLKGSKNHEPLPEDRRLRLTIGISGWITQTEDIITPWRALGRQSEVFALRWELEALTLMTALWPIGLLKVSKVVDNPFSVTMNRADKAGLVLADALINKAQGERPVTLIGYSVGARLIYSCLMSLAERRAFGLVENVILMGAPCPSDDAPWRAMRSVVAGRLINVYSENDYILGFLYRTFNIQYGVAGLQEIEQVKGIENINVSDMVSGHLRLQYLVGSILEKIGFEDIDVSEVAREEETLALMEEEEKREENKKDGSNITPEEEAKEMEKDVKHKTDQTMMQKAAEKLRLS
ncbi:putative Uncharacterized membrane protein C6F6.13c [Glarea lozoyensis 74030]|uniref:Putative Uncharacterized membrane protein C6F6.13c n=1 Tax=Glarea lozoyensis (strain ATCC 74030 / MF5533) TaxID=1104152 RepID=H0ET27_GLAL7|nr:putative Uncharacterized membrane protein C6F6.13c [Glarea lozoyensis 74030]